MNSLVSVIIPSYNHGEFISDAIDSVISQTYKNWELIIIDNYSSDETDLILNNYLKSKINIKIEKINNKNIIAKSRNRGVKIATGDYIAFLDSDDIWFPNKLNEQLTIIKEKDADAVFTNFYKISQNQCSIIPAVKRKVEEVEFLDIFPKKNIICQSSVLLKSEIFNEIGFLNEDYRLKTIEDYDFWLRMLDKKYKFMFCDKPLVLYRSHNNNQSNNDYKNIKRHIYHLITYGNNFNSIKFKQKYFYFKILLKKYLRKRIKHSFKFK